MTARTSAWRPLKAVLGGQVEVPDSLEVSDITLDSRGVTPGAAFLACRGRTHHGLEFAPQAIAAGAGVILWEPAPGVSAPSAPPSVLVCAVPQLSAQLGFIADRFFDAPSASITLTGVTGTNGKTTCAWLLAQALTLSGRRAAYLGTLGVGAASADGGGLSPLAHTTPDALTLHRSLARLRDEGYDAVAMEVSSHALDQQRCAGLRFHTAVFTNLTRDHLDYHGDMAQYGAAKAKLFAWPTLSTRVINVDDTFGFELAQEMWRIRDAGLVMTSQRPSEWLLGSGGYVCTTGIEATVGGLALQLETHRGSAQLVSSLRGEFNIDNLLSVLGALLALDVPLAEACGALARCQAPPGRMQAEGGEGSPLVLIDYAHTPDALEKALRAARAHCRGRLWCVFGCGGERDAGKRSQMGQVAALGADQLIVTDDNPRREDPAHITAQIVQGVESAGRVARVVHDRAGAIGVAISEATAEDVILVAGKGHEDYQLIGTERRAFSDARVVRDALAVRRRA